MHYDDERSARCMSLLLELLNWITETVNTCTYVGKGGNDHGIRVGNNNNKSLRIFHLFSGMKLLKIKRVV